MQFKQTTTATRFCEYHLSENGDVLIINSTIVLHRQHRTRAEPRSQMYSLFGTTTIIENKLKNTVFSRILFKFPHTGHQYAKSPVFVCDLTREFISVEIPKRT